MVGYITSIEIELRVVDIERISGGDAHRTIGAQGMLHCRCSCRSPTTRTPAQCGLRLSKDTPVLQKIFFFWNDYENSKW